jgi:hypothetical protein
MRAQPRRPLSTDPRRRRVGRPPDAIPVARHGGRIAAEFLPEANGYGVLQVGPAGLDDRIECGGFRLERQRQVGDGAEQFIQPPQAPQADRRRDLSLVDWAMLT